MFYIFAWKARNFFSPRLIYCRDRPGWSQELFACVFHGDRDPSPWAPTHGPPLPGLHGRKLDQKQRNWNSNQAFQYGIWESQGATSGADLNVSTPSLPQTAILNRVVKPDRTQHYWSNSTGLPDSPEFDLEGIVPHPGDLISNLEQIISQICCTVHYTVSENYQ